MRRPWVRISVRVLAFFRSRSPARGELAAGALADIDRAFLHGVFQSSAFLAGRAYRVRAGKDDDGKHGGQPANAGGGGEHERGARRAARWHRWPPRSPRTSSSYSSTRPRCPRATSGGGTTASAAGNARATGPPSCCAPHRASTGSSVSAKAPP